MAVCCMEKSVEGDLGRPVQTVSYIVFSSSAAEQSIESAGMHIRRKDEKKAMRPGTYASEASHCESHGLRYR